MPLILWHGKVRLRRSGWLDCNDRRTRQLKLAFKNEGRDFFGLLHKKTSALKCVCDLTIWIVVAHSRCCILQECARKKMSKPRRDRSSLVVAVRAYKIEFLAYPMSRGSSGIFS